MFSLDPTGGLNIMARKEKLALPRIKSHTYSQSFY
jgi:hypothetical protein